LSSVVEEVALATATRPRARRRSRYDEPVVPLVEEVALATVTRPLPPLVEEVALATVTRPCANRFRAVAGCGGDKRTTWLRAVFGCGAVPLVLPGREEA